MKEIRKILTVRLLNPEASTRYIAEISRCSRPTVKDYLKLVAQQPIAIAKLIAMTDRQLTEHLGLQKPVVKPTATNRPLQDWLNINAKRLSERHMTRRLLHELYLEDHQDGLHYSQFCFVLRQQLQNHEASGMFDHKAGDKLYLDFTGDKLHWQDEHGTKFQEELFIAVMGASSYHFSLPVPSQKQEDFVHATQEAFLYLGGVPNAVVPDCLKSAVLKHDGYEPVHNPLFARLLDHYQVVSIPARPHHPKDKPMVETAVKYLYTQILARLNNSVFADRTAMLCEWRKAVERLNRLPFQKMPGSRQERFIEVDQPALRALPATLFSLTSILNQTVQPTLTVYIPMDKTLYSVPYSLLGKKVEILVNPQTIEIWHGNERYATHQRQPNAGKVLVAEHLAAAQRWYADRNPEESVRTLRLAGVHVASWAQYVLDHEEHEDIAWRKLAGLTRLVCKYDTRIDRVCRIALGREEFRLSDLRHIIASDEDIATALADELTNELAFHENIRGPEYYEQVVSL